NSITESKTSLNLNVDDHNELKNSVSKIEDIISAATGKKHTLKKLSLESLDSEMSLCPKPGGILGPCL
ncbi:MAG: hypothetical protein ACHQD8_02085, partial [Chitinophagales bacterium]